MLRGKTAVITGCLQGIGNETLKLFAQNGCSIFACALRKTDVFETQVEELKRMYHVEIYPVYFDMMDTNAMKSAIREIQKAKRNIDVLVNIAGITRDAIFQMISLEQMQETFQVNFFSQIIFSQYIVRLMLKNKTGNVIFTSSITGMDGNKGQLVYGASKAALISAAKTMSEELGSEGIRVNVIAPGVIKTPMTDVLDKEILDKKLKNAKIPRIGSPEEVANVILFLASERSEYITGQVIRIDGGIR